LIEGAFDQLEKISGQVSFYSKRRERREFVHLEKKQFCVVLLTAILSVARFATAANSVWVVVPSANPDAQNVLQAVSGGSSSDIWAVGYVINSEPSGDQLTLAEHWDGTSWTVFPTPSPGNSECAKLWQNPLNSVAEVSTDNVWAVGFYCGPSEAGGGNEQLTLIEQWNGSEWNVVTSPNPSSYAGLYGVAAVSARDVWAVGQNYGSTEPSTLIEHWNGAKWSIVPSPNPAGRTAYLGAVSAVSATDIWAVGYSGASTAPYLIPLIEHYNGSTWSIVSSPYVPSSRFNQLNGVMAISANDVWAVGYQNENGNGQDGQGLIEHWNGTKWNLVNSPVVGDVAYLYSITGTSSTNAWAVGYLQNSELDVLPIIEQWNGRVWKVVTSPDPGGAAQFFGATTTQGQAWAVGTYSIQIGSWVNDPLTLTIESN